MNGKPKFNLFIFKMISAKIQTIRERSVIRTVRNKNKTTKINEIELITKANNYLFIKEDPILKYVDLFCRFIISMPQM